MMRHYAPFSSFYKRHLAFWASSQNPYKMLSTIEDLPCEVLEIVFAHLPLAIDQQQLTLVCKKWRWIVQNMRRIPSLKGSKYEQRIYVRLPAAGTLNSRELTCKINALFTNQYFIRDHCRYWSRWIFSAV